MQYKAVNSGMYLMFALGHEQSFSTLAGEREHSDASCDLGHTWLARQDYDKETETFISE
jgi:hypothetical protein